MEWTKVHTIIVSVMGLAGLVAGPIAAVDYLDARNASASLEKVMLEDRIMDAIERCEDEEDEMKAVKWCERSQVLLRQLCSQFPESWLCEEYLHDS